MSWGVLLWVYPVWDSLGFLDLDGYFLPHFREVFNYYLLKYFLMPFPFVFFWDNYDLNLGTFNIVPEVSEVVLISFNSFFFFFLYASFISTILSSISLILSSASVILLLDPWRVFLISFIALFIIYWLFLISSSSAAAKLLQSCPTLSNPMDWSPPGSSIHGIFQARVLEWGAIAFSVGITSCSLVSVSHQVQRRASWRNQILARSGREKDKCFIFV